MNYADIQGGTWYPMGGMYSVVSAMHRLAVENGVEFIFNENVTGITVQSDRAKKVIAENSVYEADVVIGGGDDHYSGQTLLSKGDQNYDVKYWERLVMGAQCHVYSVVINKKLQHALHHSLFFDVPFDRHGHEIYESPTWPSDPLFYVSISSVTDLSVAPEGCENLVFLIPVAAGLTGDTEELRN